VWKDDASVFRGLDPDAHGVPREPLITVDLDLAAGWRDAEIAAAARALSDELAITVGFSHVVPESRLRPLARALTLSLVPKGDDDAAYIVVDDIAAAMAALRTAVNRSPRAAVALAGLVRATSELGARAGLMAEAATYSTMLGGSEFRRWLDGRDRRPVAQCEQPVLTERRGDALLVLLNRPDRHNAMNAAMREALMDALAVPMVDPTIRSIELRGAGPSFGCGGDLDEFGMATDLAAAFVVRLDRGPWRLLHRLRERTHAHLHGACIGAGLEMAAFAGSVTAAADTRLQLPEVSMGLVPGAGGTVSVVRRIGRWRSAWMMITGAPVPVATALRWGLIDAVEER
jgi:enoyl-CoA hydratase/carnithine racemase